MPAQFGAFDQYGRPVRSPDNPAFTGTPPAAPVLRDLPTPAPERMFNPNSVPQLPSVQPQGALPAPVRLAGDPGNRRGALLNGSEQRAMDDLYPPEPTDPNAAPTQLPERGQPDRRGFLRRALDLVLPPAGAATLDQPGMGPRQYVGAGSDYPAPEAPTGAAAWKRPTPAGPNSVDVGPMFPEAYDPTVMRQQLGGAIRDARAARNARQAAGFEEDAALARAAGDSAYADSAQGKAIALRPHRYPTSPTLAEPWGALPNSQAAAAPDSESYLGAPALPQPGARRYPTAPLAGSKSAGAAPELQPGQASTADYVPAYQMGPGGALTLAMPGGGTAELTPGPGANRIGVRVSELAGQKLGGGQYESDAQVAARRPDLYGANGKPLLAGPFGHAVDQQLVDAAASIDARNAERAQAANVQRLMNRADDFYAQAGRAPLLRQQQGMQQQGSQLLQAAAQLQQQGLLAQAQDATTRRGQDMQLAARERRAPIAVPTGDGSVLYDPGSGQWLQPPGAQGGGLGKQDADRLKGITGHIGKAMGMDSAANPIDAATGAAYTAASRIGGGAYMATRGVRQFAGYTDADFAGIGQDVAAGRAAIRTGKDGMAYAIYHGEDGKAYGVPIGPAENYANIQPAAGQPAAAR